MRPLTLTLPLKLLAPLPSHDCHRCPCHPRPYYVTRSSINYHAWPHMTCSSFMPSYSSTVICCLPLITAEDTRIPKVPSAQHPRPPLHLALRNLAAVEDRTHRMARPLSGPCPCREHSLPCVRSTILCMLCFHSWSKTFHSVLQHPFAPKTLVMIGRSVRYW